MATMSVSKTDTKPKGIAVKQDRSYFIRRLARSGSSRYISISTILPKEWQVVKITKKEQSATRCLLEIIAIA